MRVDISGFNRKSREARRAIQTTFPLLLDDAAAFVLGRLVDSVLNGEEGTDYPKDYPSSVTPGQSGFVGVVTSNLRRSIGIQKESEFETRVTQVFEQLAPYHQDMIDFTVEKYGVNFYQIAIELYGTEVARKMVEALLKIARAVGTGRPARYTNPFPQ